MGKGVHKSEYFLIYLEGFIKLKMFKCDMINQTYIRFVVFVVSPREKSITYIFPKICLHVLVKYVSDV